jgi:ABC-type glutathione transport system ATPase component
MEPIVINLLAGPGAGKSTTAAAIFSLIKLHNVNAELVTEIAKDFTWEQRHKTLRNQYYVWAKQQHRFWRVKDEVDVIVTDSPLFFSLVYGEPKPNAFYELVMDEFNSYNNMNYFIDRHKPYQSKGRNESEEEARNLDDAIKYKLKENYIKYTEIPGTIEGINIITNAVLEKLGVEPIINMGKI